jgi:hypothetical protein
MAREPLFSIVIDNYNYAAYLRASLDSALAQNWPRTEVIVVDDGSTDHSRAIIAEFGDRVRPVLQPNGGQASAFNAGVAVARGEYIGFLDSDDVWFDDKVERVLAAFARHPAAGWLRHRLEVTDAELRPTGTAVPGIRGTRLRDPDPHEFLEGCFTAPTSAIVLRRAVAAQVFPLPLRTDGSSGVALNYDADAYLLNRAAATGAPFLSMEDVLGLYRRHPQQRYVSSADLAAVLERQIAVAAGVSSALEGRLGTGAVPSSVFKHRAVLAALNGHSLVDRERFGPALDGVRCVLPLVRVNPRLFARQGMALALATIAPRRWLRKLVRQQALHAGGADES